MDHTAGFLFSLALHDFSLSGLFVSLRVHDGYDAIDAHIVNLSSRLGFIRMPSAMCILWDHFLPLLLPDPFMRYGFYRTFDVLASVGHRNVAVLSRLQGLVTSILDALYGENENTPHRERFVLLQLLGRLLDMGSAPADARRLFRRATGDGTGLNDEVTGLISVTMKSRWPDHFSMDGCAKLVLEEESMKGMPSTGFTFMAWLWFETLPQKRPHNIFSVSLSTPRQIIALSLLPEGKLHFLSTQSSTNTNGAVLPSACIQPMRWTHLTLVHYPHRASNPSIRTFSLPPDYSPEWWVRDSYRVFRSLLRWRVDGYAPLAVPEDRGCRVSGDVHLWQRRQGAEIRREMVHRLCLLALLPTP
jgi:hypothetical protein